MTTEHEIHTWSRCWGYLPSIMRDRTDPTGPSTTARWEYRKILKRPAAPSDTAPQGPPSLKEWPRRSPLTLTIVYRGGSEAWWEIKARGQTFRVPGHTCLHDVLERIEGR